MFRCLNMTILATHACSLEFPFHDLLCHTGWLLANLLLHSADYQLSHRYSLNGVVYLTFIAFLLIVFFLEASLAILTIFLHFPNTSYKKGINISYWREGGLEVFILHLYLTIHKSLLARQQNFKFLEMCRFAFRRYRCGHTSQISKEKCVFTKANEHITRQSESDKQIYQDNVQSCKTWGIQKSPVEDVDRDCDKCTAEQEAQAHRKMEESAQFRTMEWMQSVDSHDEKLHLEEESDGGVPIDWSLIPQRSEGTTSAGGVHLESNSEVSSYAGTPETSVCGLYDEDLYRSESSDEAIILFKRQVPDQSQTRGVKVVK
jgi:hypothetical protein